MAYKDIRGRLSTTLAANPGTSDGMAIVISGRSSVGDGGEGLAVWDENSTVTSDDATVWGSGTGRWLRVTDGSHYNARWFGAHPDATAAINGAAIQAAIDAAISSTAAGIPRRKVIVPDGEYNIDRTIRLGKTVGFSSLELTGSGYAYEAGFGGTILVPNFSNAPAINVAGARGSVVSNLTVLGLNIGHIADNGLGTETATSDDTVSANWWDPSLSASGTSRYAPYAGIAVDGWAGAAPGTSYPTTHHPYGQSFSSDVLIDNVHIRGFCVGVVNQPADADGNADFTVVRRCNISNCVYGISVCNTQSRNVGIQDVKVAQVHTVLTSNKHGKQNGKLNGNVDNLSVAFSIQLHDFGTSSICGPLSFSCCYSESLWRLGEIGSTTSSEQGVTYNECLFGLHLQTKERGVPATVIGGAQQSTLIRFSGTSFANYPSVLVFDQAGVFLDGVVMQSVDREGAASKEYEALFHNATCDGAILLDGTDLPDEHRIKFHQVDADTLADAGSIVTRRGFGESSRPYCIPVHVNTVSSRSDSYDEVPVRRLRSYALDKSTFSSCTLVHGASSSPANTGVLTIVLASATAAQAELYGFAPGDFLVDQATKSVFAIRSFDDGTNTIVAELQNNYKVSGGNYTTVTAFSTTVGTLYAYNSRLYTPTYAVIADVTSGSAVLASTGRDDGYAAFISSGGVPDAIKVGDRVALAPTLDSWASETTNKVSAIAADGTSITLDGNASRTAARKRLPIWIRKPPANEASR